MAYKTINTNKLSLQDENKKINVTWITYKGRNILYNNMSGLEEEQQIESMNQVENEIMKSDNPVLIINNITDTCTSEPVKARADLLEENTEKIKKSVATVGAKGLKKFIGTSINKNMYFAKNLKDAKEWLIKQ